MSLLDTASLIVTPNGYKEGKLYSVIPSDGSGDMSVVRATTATRVNTSGLVELVPYNLLQQSNTFSTTWVNTSSTETGGQSGYDGSTNAWKIDITAAFGQIIQILPTSGYNTVSIYAKAGTLGFCRLRCDASVSAIADFDLSNGSLAYSFGIVSATSENVGNGWFRLQMYFNATATNLRIYPIVAANDLTATSGNIYIQDAQLNEGTLLPYQKTETRLNIPRLDYSNGTCPSLLVEPQRTNLNAYSEDISQTQYNKVRCTVSANSVVSPSGYTNADKIIQDSANTSWGGVSQVYSPTAPATLSVFAKKIDNDYIAVIGHSVNPTAAWFNLADGTVGTTEVNVTSASIVDYGNGWYRCSITATTVNRFTVLHASSNGGNTAPVNSETALWGFQLEASSSYPTSYIPTTSASVTRNADVISKTGISSLIGQTEGTVFVDAVFGDVYDTNNLLMTLSDGTVNNLVYINRSNGNAEIVVKVSGVSQVTYNSSILSAGVHKVAIGYKANEFVVYIDGVLAHTDTSGSVPACSKLNIGSYWNNSLPYNNGINAAALWKTRLTNDELAQLTTI